MEEEGRLKGKREGLEETEEGGREARKEGR